MKIRRPMSALLALLMALALIPAAGFVTANAANTTVNIMQGQTVDEIRAAIQSAINASAVGDTVTVTGSKTGAIRSAYYGALAFLMGMTNEGLYLNIPAGKHLIWKASLKSNSFNPGAMSLIVLYGIGTFEFAEGGTISCTDYYDTAISSNIARLTTTTAIVISGGVISSSCYAIYTDGNVAVTGGTVSPIFTRNGTIAVTGGTVESIELGVPSMMGDGIDYGPCAAAYLEGTCIELLEFYDFLPIVEVDTLAVPKSRDNTDAGITVKAGTDTALWDCTGAVPVIRFSNGKSIEWGEYAPHTHTWGTTWVNDATGHWKECACGEKDSFAAHTSGEWIVDLAATHAAAGSGHKECTTCEYVTETEAIPIVPHTFAATWVNDATGHWKECACGEKDSFAAHTSGDWLIDVTPTETTAGSQHKQCTVCGYVTATETIPATGAPKSYVGLLGLETKYASNFWNWFKFIVLFGWIWMWF